MTCYHCNKQYKVSEEKQTDVSIATQLIGNVVKERCDISVIVSADSDLAPPINFIREFDPNHKIFIYFPPKRYSSELNNLGDQSVFLKNYSKKFDAAVMPDEVTLKNGTKIFKPTNWV